MNRYLGLVFLLAVLYSCQETKFAEGKRIYAAYCSNCHMDDGTGLGTLIPPLANADYLTNYRSAIPCIIQNGQEGPIIVNDTLYNGIMPGAELSDVQMLNLINYMNNSWGNSLGYTTIDQIKEWKKECSD